MHPAVTLPIAGKVCKTSAKKRDKKQSLLDTFIFHSAIPVPQEKATRREQ